MSWIWENREWLFSGVAVALISGIVAAVLRLRHQSGTGHHQRQSGGKGSTNIQIGSIERDSGQP